MMRRQRIFNEIIDFWQHTNQSSTPRRGELQRWLRERKIPLSRTAIQRHLVALERDGWIELRDGVIVLRRKERHEA